MCSQLSEIKTTFHSLPLCLQTTFTHSSYSQPEFGLENGIKAQIPALEIYADGGLFTASVFLSNPG